MTTTTIDPTNSQLPVCAHRNLVELAVLQQRTRAFSARAPRTRPALSRPTTTSDTTRSASMRRRLVSVVERAVAAIDRRQRADAAEASARAIDMRNAATWT